MPHTSEWRAIGLEACLYVVLTVAITWPVGANPGATVPGDYGDPIFVCWVMSWVMQQLTGIFTGDAGSLTAFWQAPIFFPERNTLAMSEHFLPQSLQALPVFLATGNLILSYNVVVLLSFVLTALGTSLLVQELTGSRLAGVFAGIIAAFNSHRLIWEVSHLQTLSIQWLPFALLGLHRFIRSGSIGALALGGGSVLALFLSSGYYLLYCAPFVALFTLADMLLHRKLTDRKLWAGLIVAAICVGLVTAPFVIPYANVQRQFGFERSLQELVLFSVTFDHLRDAMSWLSIAAAFAALGLVGVWRLEGRVWRRDAILFGVLTVLALWLSFGPVVQSGGHSVGIPGIYQLLFNWVPGFKGMRVVSRYAAVMLAFLSVSAGIGAAWLMRAAPRTGRAAVLVAGAWFLWLVWPAPFQFNAVLPSPGLQQPPPGYLTPSPDLPHVYAAVASLDRNAVIAELPFGDPWYEIRYMFFAATHQRPLMNGYSGFFPPSYVARQATLKDPLARPAAAFDALSGATHIVVHQDAWTDDTGAKIVAWLEAAGADVIASSDGAALLALNPVRRNAQR